MQELVPRRVTLWPLPLPLRSVILIVINLLYVTVVLIPVYLGNIGAADKDRFRVGIEPEWYFIYRGQNYHDGVTYVLARTLLYMVPLIAVPVAITTTIALRKFWYHLGNFERTLHLVALAVSGICFTAFCLSLRVAADWLIQ